MPSVFHYNNPSSFLRDYYLDRKAKEPKFSFRYFSRIAGYSSSGSMKLVVDGKRKISKQAATRIGEALKLGRNECTYFKTLAEFDLCKDESPRKKELFEKMKFYRAFSHVHNLDDKYNLYLSHWFYPVIRELTLLQNFKEDSQWIVEQLNGLIDPDQAMDALELLKDLGVLTRTDKDKLVPSEVEVSFQGSEIERSARLGQKQLIQKALEAVEGSSLEHNTISSLTVAVSQQSYLKTKELIQRFNQDIKAVALASENGDAVYQLNIQFFNLSKAPWHQFEPNEK